MTVTIDGITYEGSPSEIRDIVENPPNRQKHGNIWKEWPDDITSPDFPAYPGNIPSYPGINYPSTSPIYPTRWPVTATWQQYSCS